MKVGDIVKLNPEIFPKDKLDNPYFQGGSLNYFVCLLTLNLEVIKEFYDTYHGEMVQVKALNLLNGKVVENPIVFRKEDCIVVDSEEKSA